MWNPKNTSQNKYNPNSKSDLFVLHIIKPLLPEHPNVYMLPISTSRCPAIQWSQSVDKRAKKLDLTGLASTK